MRAVQKDNLHANLLCILWWSIDAIPLVVHGLREQLDDHVTRAVLIILFSSIGQRNSQLQVFVRDNNVEQACVF